MAPPEASRPAPSVARVGEGRQPASGPGRPSAHPPAGRSAGARGTFAERLGALVGLGSGAAHRAPGGGALWIEARAPLATPRSRAPGREATDPRAGVDRRRAHGSGALGRPELLAALAPPPALTSPAPQPPTDACAAGTGLAHAQAAALAERLIASVRVGRAGGGRHAVHLRLHPLGPALEGLDVRLASVGDRIEAVVVGEHGAAAEHFAALFERACAARGVCLDAIEVQTR